MKKKHGKLADTERERERHALRLLKAAMVIKNGGSYQELNEALHPNKTAPSKKEGTMKKKPTKTVKVTKTHPAAAKPKPIWLTRDADANGELCLYAKEPYKEVDGRWYPESHNGHQTPWDYVTGDIRIIITQLFSSLPGPGECWRIEI